jgi:hypothetical protein
MPPFDAAQPGMFPSVRGQPLQSHMQGFAGCRCAFYPLAPNVPGTLAQWLSIYGVATDNVVRACFRTCTGHLCAAFLSLPVWAHTPVYVQKQLLAQSQEVVAFATFALNRTSGWCQFCGPCWCLGPQQLHPLQDKFITLHLSQQGMEPCAQQLLQWPLCRRPCCYSRRWQWQWEHQMMCCLPQHHHSNLGPL